jgi:pimeloyl-ACP methyl ester carboxylesterase
MSGGLGGVRHQVGGLEMHSLRAIDPDHQREAVVLVHGLGVSGRNLVRLARALAPWYDVHVPDLPMFGQSRPYGPRELGHVLAAWMHTAELRRATVVGVSYGCQVATWTAVQHASFVERVVLVAPTIDPEVRTMGELLRRGLARGGGEPLGLRLMMLADYWRAGPRALLASYSHLLTDAIEERLPAVGQPALVVRGGRDTLVRQGWAEEVTSLLPDGRLVIVPGAPHSVQYTAPVVTAAVIRDFLRDVRTSTVPSPPEVAAALPSEAG